MKFISKILLIVGFFVFTLPFQFSAAAENNPYEMANTVAGQTFSEIKANKDKLSDKASVLGGVILLAIGLRMLLSHLL